MQGYFLLLWDTPISLIGLGYLLLLAAMFVARPLRGRFCERNAAGHWLGPSPAAARALLERQQLHLRAALLLAFNAPSLCVNTLSCSRQPVHAVCASMELDSLPVPAQNCTDCTDRTDCHLQLEVTGW